MTGDFPHPHPVQLIQLLITQCWLFHAHPPNPPLNNQGHLDDCNFFEAQFCFQNKATILPLHGVYYRSDAPKKGLGWGRVAV